MFLLYFFFPCPLPLGTPQSGCSVRVGKPGWEGAGKAEMRRGNDQFCMYSCGSLEGPEKLSYAPGVGTEHVLLLLETLIAQSGEGRSDGAAAGTDRPQALSLSLFSVGTFGVCASRQHQPWQLDSQRADFSISAPVYSTAMWLIQFCSHNGPICLFTLLGPRCGISD